MTPGLPLVFISGYGAHAVEERGDLPTSSVLVHKPFSSRDLLLAVEHALAGVPARVL
jgi:hypothetical protein